MSFCKKINYNCLLPVLSAIATCLFLGLCYPHHLHYQEQFQLFLFDSDYALDVMSVPGGIADYLGRFLTQFFLYSWAGATILALLIAFIQALVAQTTSKGWLLSLSVLTPLFLVRMLCDETALAGSIIAILLALLVAWIVMSFGNRILRRIIVVLLIPAIYWAVGPIAILFVALIVFDELKHDKSFNTIVYLLAVLVFALSHPAFLAQFIPVEPKNMYLGVHYFRAHDNDSSNLWWAVLSAALPAGINTFWKNGSLPLEKRWRSALLTLVVACAACAALVYPNVNSKAETVMAYDFMARMQLWNRMQLTAEKQAPNNALCATALNLALAKTGQLGDKMFHYPQNGIGGLLPEVTRDAMSPLITAEVYYHLGMINTAQRYVFEAQEAILDFQKSGRCYKRLAETNLICGNYAVARKYLLALQKTLFYSDWATQTLSLLGDEEAINQHKEYGMLRQNLYKEDDFFTNNDYAEVLLKLYKSNTHNKMAYEYTLAAYLLQTNLKDFSNVFNMNDAIQYKNVPVHFQEAQMLWWSFGEGGKLPPKGIRQDREGIFKKFLLDAELYKNNPRGLARSYGKTYWYYCLTH